jgi:hypothetical protein
MSAWMKKSAHWAARSSESRVEPRCYGATPVSGCILFKQDAHAKRIQDGWVSILFTLRVYILFEVRLSSHLHSLKIGWW